MRCSLMNTTDKPPRARLTSDSPAMNGSCISFTAALEFPPCQKEDSSGNLVYDEHCDDGMMEASGASYSYNLLTMYQCKEKNYLYFKKSHLYSQIRTKSIFQCV